MLIDRRLLSQFDTGLLAISLIIPCFGLIVLFSAGYDVEPHTVSLGLFEFSVHSPAFFKQLIFFFAGMVAMLVGMSLPTQVLHRYSFLIYGICLLMLVVVLKLGFVSNGSRRWFGFGGFNVQPAEAMKIALILALSRFLSRTPPGPGGYKFTQLFVPFLMFLAPMGLIAKQPDLGTALAVGAVGFLLVLFVGIQKRILIIMVLGFCAVLYPAWNVLHGYQQRRVLVLFNPEADPLGSGYHITQSKIAVGSGQFFGKGYMQGTQTQLEFLPEHTTDFIFSVLSEEWGFVGSVFVLCLYAVFLYRLLRVVARSRDTFAALVVFGISSLFFVHIGINIGMVVGVLPVVGIPLPLFSYGGSSIISSMFGIGIVIGTGMRRNLYSQRG